MSLTFALKLVKKFLCAFFFVILHKLTNLTKVIKKNADIYIYRSKRKVNSMYYNWVWPGAYSFKGEIKLFTAWIKNQVDIILKKIEETENKLG